jgi:CBS domain-containing protein
MPEDPRQELVVALAGPAVNVVIAAILLAILVATATFQPLGQLGVARGSMLERLMVVNVWLVLFNMLPAFPMDGGRVLRALLATRLTYDRATRLAASVGQGTALILGFVGLFTNPFLVFVALFVWIGAGQEAGAVSARSALAGLPVRAAMLTDFRVLAPHDTLTRAVELLLSGSQTEFPVVEDGRVLGILRRRDLVRALAEQGRDAPVERVMFRDFPTADADERLEGLFTRLHGSECTTVPVRQGGRIVGLVTLDNIAELLMVRTALEERSAASSVPSAP